MRQAIKISTWTSLLVSYNSAVTTTSGLCAGECLQARPRHLALALALALPLPAGARIIAPAEEGGRPLPPVPILPSHALASRPALSHAALALCDAAALSPD